MANDSLGTLVDMDTATIFQYNSIQASECSFWSRDSSDPLGGKVVVHEVLEYSVPEVVPYSSEYKPYFLE